MPLETATHINDLVSSNPAATDSTNQGDDHIRLIKTALKTSLPGVTAPITRVSGSGPGFLAGAGTAGAPSIAFSDEPTLGFYRNIAGSGTFTGNLGVSGGLFGAAATFTGLLTGVNETLSGTLTAASVVATNVNATTVTATTVVGALPAGAIMDFAGPTAPTGWIACDGGTLPSASFPELFAAIGTTWGGTATNFGLPNFMTRYRRHRDNNAAFANTVGTLQSPQNLAHTHTYSATTSAESADHTHTFSGTSSAVSNDHTHAFSGTSSGMSANAVHAHTVSGGVYGGNSNVGVQAGGTYIAPNNSGGATGAIVIDAVNLDHTHTYSGNTGGISANHTHTYSGTTSGRSAAHSHTLSGTTSGGSADNANELRPYSATVLTCIKLYN